MTCGLTFRLARTRLVDDRSSASGTSLRIRSLADYTINTLGRSFRKRQPCGLGRDSETLTWTVRSFSSCGPPPALQTAVPTGGRIVCFDDVLGLAALVTVVCVRTEPTLP